MAQPLIDTLHLTIEKQGENENLHNGVHEGRNLESGFNVFIRLRAVKREMKAEHA